MTRIERYLWVARVAGFEPATLALGPRCSTPLSYRRTEEGGARGRNRTADLVRTKDALCQLSYKGELYSGWRTRNCAADHCYVVTN